MKIEIHIANTGERFIVGSQDNVLRGMERLGRKGIPVGCRGGGCGVCKIRVVAGHYRAEKMSRSCLSVDDEAAGIALACKVHPDSDLEIEAIGPMARAVTRGLHAWRGTGQNTAPDAGVLKEKQEWL